MNGEGLSYAIVSRYYNGMPKPIQLQNARTKLTFLIICTRCIARKQGIIHKTFAECLVRL